MEIATRIDSGILTIEFNRPEKKNAITAAMYTAMADALNAAQGDAAVRAILITGKPEVFTAGNDLEDFMRNPPRGEDPPVVQFMKALAHSDKPVVAAVHSVAMGGELP